MIRRALALSLALVLIGVAVAGCKPVATGTGASSSQPATSAATTADPTKKASDVDVTGPIASGGIVNKELTIGIAMPATVDGVASATVIPSFVLTSTTTIDKSGTATAFDGKPAILDQLGGQVLSIHGALNGGRWVATTVKAVPDTSVNIQPVQVTGVVTPSAAGIARIDGRTTGSDPNAGASGTFIVETPSAFAGVPASVEVPITYNAKTVLVGADGKQQTLGQLFTARPKTAIGVVLPPEITVQVKKAGTTLTALRIQRNY